MANGTKLSALTLRNTITDDTIFYIVDTNDPVNSRSKGITKTTLQNALGITTGGNRVVSGGMIWVSGLTYESKDLVYEIDGTQFAITDGTQVTLDAADGSNDRIDLIYGDNTGSLGKSTGTPAATPSANTLEFTQLQLTLAYVATGATTPQGITERAAYLEDAGQPTEFDATENTSTVRIDLANTTTPITGTKDIKTLSALNDNDTITLTHATATTYSDFSYLTFDIKLLSAWDSADNFTIILKNNGVSFLYFFNVSTLIDINDTSTTQSVTILKSDFTTSGLNITEFNEIVFLAYVSTNLQFQLDNVKIYEDTGASTPQTYLTEDEADLLYSALVHTHTASEITDFEEAVRLSKGERIVSNASSTYDFNHNLANDWKITLTADTTFTDSNLPTGTKTTEFTVKMTGSFVPTFPSYWDIVGDSYDGSLWNFYAVQVHNGTTSSEEVTSFLTNL